MNDPKDRIASRPDPVGDFVERFGAMLADAGMPRMAARTFATLLSTESGGCTAAELGGRLQGSIGAISGAVRYLIHLGLADREQLPRSRKDFYRVRPDVWFDITMRQEAMYARWLIVLGQGVDAVGAHTAAGVRLSESRSFFAFLQSEMPAMIRRWHAERAELPTLRSPNSPGRDPRS